MLTETQESPGQTANQQLTDRLVEFDYLRVKRHNGYYGTIPSVMFVLQGSDAQTSANFQAPFFIADRAYEVIGVIERHATAATDGTLQVKNVLSGEANSSGTNVLDSALNLTTGGNTNQTGVLSSTKRNLVLPKGSALVPEAYGLLTALWGVTIAVFLKAI